jgi:hypothetical protein
VDGAVDPDVVGDDEHPARPTARPMAPTSTGIHRFAMSLTSAPR